MQSQEAKGEAKAAPSGTNTVHYGPYSNQINGAGKNIKDIKKVLQKFMSVPGDAHAIVNGQKVPDDYTLKENEDLQFHRPAGDKG